MNECGNFFVQQGWQCPICKRVYSPNTPMCWYCGGAAQTTTTASTSLANILNKHLSQEDKSIYDKMVKEIEEQTEASCPNNVCKDH